MALLFSCSWADHEAWRAAFAAEMPDLEFRLWPDEIGDPAEIDFALVWAPERGDLRRYENLRAIFSLGAGVDHVLRDPDLPTDVPLVRLVDPVLTQRMTEYVAHWVMHYHRDFHRFAAQQRHADWREWPTRDRDTRSVGILGLGELGGAAAHALAQAGFRVAGWSRSAKEIDGVESFVGASAFHPFLARTEILVCLLPLTPETEGIIDSEALSALPEGAAVINAARGGHLVEDELLQALDSGHVSGATLDVFRTEPLPGDHPFWRHPAVTITPHIAALNDPRSATASIAANIRRIRSGHAPVHVVDRTRGY